MNYRQVEPTVLFKTNLRNTVYDVMSTTPGWLETENEEDWDINWADVGWIRDNFDHLQMEDHQVWNNIIINAYLISNIMLQKINHFRNHYELTRKDLLVKNLKRMKKQLQRT